MRYRPLSPRHTHAHTLAHSLARIALCGFLAIVGGLIAGSPTRADTALLVENTRTLYQRVITKPQARILAEPRAGAAIVTREVPAFSIFYVYERRDGYVAVGVNVTGNRRGWIAADRLVDWKQSIVVAFNNRVDAGRQRQLFFRERGPLAAILERENFATEMAGLRVAAAAGRAATSNVVSIEPETVVDIDRNFYLFPILSHQAAWLPLGQEGNLLEVASITANQQPPERSDFKAGVVFVVDTTRSMQPYIDRTKQAIRQIQGALTNSAVGANVRFGLVGFRQNISANRALEYHVNSFLRLDQQADATRFLGAIERVSAARVSTQGFDEDSIGGVNEATENADWDGFNARFVILITDAGPRAPVLGGNLAGPMGVDQIAGKMEQKGIRLITLHLKTPDGRPDHEYAADSYRRMTQRAGQSSYIAVGDGSVVDFSSQIDGIARQLVENVRAVQAGRDVQPVDQTQGAQLMARAGRAMQLEYLGAAAGTQAPDFFRAWTADKALEDPRIVALDVRIMLTRNQLSTLAETLRPIVETGEAPGSQSDPLDYFRRVQELAARASNDSRQIADNTPLGAVLGEYLSNLPYRSPVLLMTGQDWVTLNRVQQRDILHTLKSKLRFYQEVHASPDRWVRLDPEASEGEMVTLLQLIQMP